VTGCGVDSYGSAYGPLDQDFGFHKTAGTIIYYFSEYSSQFVEKELCSTELRSNKNVGASVLNILEYLIENTLQRRYSLLISP
jgi:hypothetical protein